MQGLRAAACFTARAAAAATFTRIISLTCIAPAMPQGWFAIMHTRSAETMPTVITDTCQLAPGYTYHAQLLPQSLLARLIQNLHNRSM
jgi:hypothetical protein